MKRKTNLFYNGVNDLVDNKFITFSNYTESLTGNFLSTNTKLFPSRFLCLYIKDLNQNNKESFINLLMEYYENKLAVLRDFILTTNTNIEHNIYPLNYLLEMFENLKLEGDTWTLNNDEEEKSYKIVYIDDITEQDFNGTFSDTIYIVKLGETIYEGVLDYKDVSDDNKLYSNNVNSEKLYGWEAQSDFNFIKGLTPIFDKEENGEKYYQINSNIKSLRFVKRNMNVSRNIEDNTLIFNAIIPLYDIVDINYKNNFNTIINEKLDDFNNIGINLIDSSDNNLYVKNVPLGIWFADENVVLKRDYKSGNSQTWSLTISSQFKPFPYSKEMPQELENSGISNAYATFAEVLSKQNKVIDKFNELSNEINNINKRLSRLEDNINNIGTITNIDNLHKEIILIEQNVDIKMNEAKNEILDIMSNIKWKSTI